MACEFHVPCFLPCTEVVDSFNDTMNRCCDALKDAKADQENGNLKSTDVDNRKIYLKELNKCIGGASVLMRASYDDGDAGSSTSSGLKFNDSIVKLSIVDGDKIKTTVADLSKWQKISDTLKSPDGEVIIAVVGKYTVLPDAYKSITEALVHGGIANKTNVEIKWIDAEDLDDKFYENKFEKYFIANLNLFCW